MPTTASEHSPLNVAISPPTAISSPPKKVLDALSRRVHQRLPRQEAGDGQHFVARPQAVADAYLVGVAGQRDQVLQRERAGLGHGAAHLGQHHAVTLGLPARVAPGVLDRLEGGGGGLDFARTVQSVRHCGVLKTARQAELAAALEKAGGTI